jgi:hypothetical protein
MNHSSTPALLSLPLTILTRESTILHERALPDGKGDGASPYTKVYPEPTPAAQP